MSAGKYLPTWDDTERKLRRMDLREDPLQRVVFTSGCFDLLHPGHLWLLRQARKLGTYLVVGVNTDHSMELNGKQPVMPLEGRAAVLGALDIVDWVVPFKDREPSYLVKRLASHINVLAKGWDQDTGCGACYVASSGGVTVQLSKGPDFSSSQLVCRVEQRLLSEQSA